MNASTTNVVRQKTNQNIQVYVRLRPLNTREMIIKSNEIVEVSTNKEVVARTPHDCKISKKFTFDKAFGQDSTQREVYGVVVAPLIEEVLSGYNCTVFAYGQTGTGKTHTMVGTECAEFKSSWDDNSMIGMIPRALSHLLDRLRMMDIDHTMRVSYLELYNEELCDLLSKDDTVKIRIYDDSAKKGSVIIQGLEEVIVHTKDDVYKLLEMGKERSKTATTLMNAQSSRSHTVFSIVVHIKENGIDGEEMLKIGKLNLVDLAGSENISKSGNEKGIRTRETVNINQSLLTLGRVITALVERTPHIPYRESKLTRLLQESLGGRTKTSIIATISPGHKDIEETISTLDYAHRAKNIQNRPEINQKLTKKTVLKDYIEAIDRLKRDLMAARDKNGIYLAEDTYNELNFKMESQVKELNEHLLVIKALKDEMLNKEKIFNEVSLSLIETSEQLKKTETCLDKTTSKLIKTEKILITTKRRYDEKKMIINNHVETEAKITGEANEILAVADTATEEHHKLQETLDRRKDVDRQIQNACAEFKDKMKSAFNFLTTNLNDLCNANPIISEIIEDDIKTSAQLNNSVSMEVIEQIDTMFKANEQSYNEYNARLEEYRLKSADMNVEHRDWLNKMFAELKLKEEKKQTNFIKHLYKITNLMKEHDTIQSANFISSMDRLQNTKTVISDFQNSLESKIETIFETLKANLYESIEKLGSNIQMVHQTYENNDNTILEIEKLFEKLKISNGRNKTTSENLKNLKTDLKTNTDHFISEMCEAKNMDKFQEECSSNFEAIEKIAMTTTNDFQAKLIDFTQKIDDGITELKNDCKETIECAVNIEDMSIKNDTNIDKLLQDLRTDIVDKTQVFITSNNSKFEVLQEKIKQEMYRINAQSSQLISYNSSLANNIVKYSGKMFENLKECNDDLHNFYGRELKTYTPTGETPGRKNFTYPRVLSATSPHNIIIKRFRLDHNNSDTQTTIEEDGETTCDDMSANITEDFMPINSTPITRLNRDGIPIFPNNFMNENIPKKNVSKKCVLETTKNSSTPKECQDYSNFDETENKENVC